MWLGYFPDFFERAFPHRLDPPTVHSSLHAAILAYLTFPSRAGRPSNAKFRSRTIKFGKGSARPSLALAGRTRQVARRRPHWTIHLIQQFCTHFVRLTHVRMVRLASQAREQIRVSAPSRRRMQVTRKQLGPRKYDDKSGERRAERSADANGSANHSLSKIEMSAPTRYVRDDEWNQHAK